MRKVGRATKLGGLGTRGRLRGFFIGTEGKDIISPAPPLTIRAIFRHFWPYARPFRRYLLLSIVLLAIAPLMQGARLYMVKVTVDEVLLPRDVEPMVWIAPVVIGLTILIGGLSFINSLLSAWAGQRFALSLRGQFFDHMQNLSLSFFQTRRTGDLIARLLGDTGAVGGFVMAGVAMMFSSLFTLVVFSVGLFLIEWRLALIFFLVAPVFALLVRVLSRLIKRASRENSRRSGAMMAYAEESLSNAALVQAYNQQGAESTRFREENQGAFEASMIAMRLRSIFGPTTDLVQTLAGIGVIVVGALAMKSGDLSLGTLFLFIAYTQQLYKPMKGLAGLYNTVYGASAGAERVIEIMNESPQVIDDPDAGVLGRAAGTVEFEHVSFTYPGGTEPALSDVSFSLEPGQKVALVGHSGAGKSTLARLLLRFYDPTQGVVRVDGCDLRDVQLSSLRDNIGLLLQETLVFQGTIRENILYGRPEGSEEEMIEAAKAADAHDFITDLADGYETQVGQRGSRLSGGQRQRVAIARAMIRQAPILLLDEPTTGLDADTSTKILEPFRRLMSGCTTIVISHNLLTVRDADLILVLEDGSIVEHGSHAELLDRSGLYARFVELQATEAAAEPGELAGSQNE